MKSRTPTRMALFALIALSAAPSGCGRPLSTLTGHVTYQDKPVTGGSVVLYCEGQQIVRGQIDPNGTYTVSNVPRGRVQVTVLPPARLPEGFHKKYQTPPVINGPITPGVGKSDKEARELAIPQRFGVPEESGLAVVVGRGTTEFDIHLTR